MKELSFVIPCYNSSKTLENVIDEIETVLLKHEESNYEIVLVNDSSKDNTWATIEKLALNNNKIQGIDLGKNFGQHAAIMAGLNYSSGEIIVCLDDDGQTPADEVYKLFDALDDDTDVVYAEYEHKQHSLFRNIGSKVNDLMARTLLNKPKDLYISSYFAMKSYVADSMLGYNNPYPYVIGLVLQTTNRIKNVNINHRQRSVGESGYSLRKLFGLWVNGFTSFSVKPLRIATALGFIFAIFGAMYAFYAIIRKILNPAVPMGWSSLISAIMLTNGVVLIVLGLIGEYIGRIFISLNNKPQFVIRKRINEGQTYEQSKSND